MEIDSTHGPNRQQKNEHETEKASILVPCSMNRPITGPVNSRFPENLATGECGWPMGHGPRQQQRRAGDSLTTQAGCEGNGITTPRQVSRYPRRTASMCDRRLLGPLSSSGRTCVVVCHQEMNRCRREKISLLEECLL